MCGRLTLKTAPDQLIQMLLPLVSVVKLPDNIQPRYNVAPTQLLLGVVQNPSGRQLASFRWGLIPSWANDSSIGNRMINARRETLMEKRSFIGPLGRRRCLIVADGYYEWKPLDGKLKQAYWITPANTGIMFLAGLWERNTRVAGEPIESCTIITTQANRTMRVVHDRMPMPLMFSEAQQWLDPELNAAQAFELLQGASDDFFTWLPVSNYVNSPRNEGPKCIAAQSTAS